METLIAARRKASPLKTASAVEMLQPGPLPRDHRRWILSEGKQGKMNGPDSLNREQGQGCCM